tara:strand:- start:874 stop:1509 length:636 start_codon:yes stop_codon:yes gene_type:complete
MLLIFFSCNKKKQDNVQEQYLRPLLSVPREFGATVKVNAMFLKDVEEWQELKAVDNFLARFKKVSPNEVLGNALELESLVKSLKDSVKPALFNVLAFKVRINILHNETLRLSDMTFIPAIKSTEVNLQTAKIISAFSAVNSKVNTILLKKHFEDAIEVDVKLIGLDSTQIDSVSKKAINEKFKKSLLNEKKSKLLFSEKSKKIRLPSSEKK